MSLSRATLVEGFAVPPETLYEALLDHEGMSEWVGTRVSVVERNAEGDGGVGTVRRIHGPLPILEKVTYVNAPRRIVYRLTSGVPLLRFHRGEILIEPWGKKGAQLTWDILAESPVPGVARAITAAVRPALRDGLGRLRAKLSP